LPIIRQPCRGAVAIKASDSKDARTAMRFKLINSFLDLSAFESILTQGGCTEHAPFRDSRRSHPVETPEGEVDRYDAAVSLVLDRAATVCCTREREAKDTSHAPEKKSLVAGGKALSG
jgi:hypothetical protein